MSKNPMQEAQLSLAYGALKTNLDCCHAEDKFVSQHMSNFLGFLKTNIIFSHQKPQPGSLFYFHITTLKKSKQINSGLVLINKIKLNNL